MIIIMMIIIIIIMIIIIMITMIIGIIVVSKTKVMFTISPRSWSMIIAMMMENPGDEVSGDKKITCIVQKKTQSSLVKQLVPRNSSWRKFSLEIFSQGAISGQDSGKQLNDKWGQIYTFDIFTLCAQVGKISKMVILSRDRLKIL